ncbi:hypothetical protein [Corynebacterium endometrii]|uniref:Uncharacterized protein n=1 Tax=Corynebacterium endometrii TaxID=2488819 RepID=A0A4P7QEQ1_9CORY|nr:hypothetical protein [Corynebacterium endometrii]QCB27840.1 hypothetical protein CENDO_02710 [Corynebacterium endometrii]
MSTPYKLDYEWLRNDIDAVATVELTVKGEGAREAILAWFEEVPLDELGTRGGGGWMVAEATDIARTDADTVVLHITSGGEDVADGIQNGTESAYEALEPFGVELSWKNLPRR